jgi:hypothetical protein
VEPSCCYGSGFEPLKPWLSPKQMKNADDGVSKEFLIQK